MAEYTTSERTRTKGAVLVTGASRGVGRAVALLLDRTGYQVFAGVRRTEDGEALTREASARLVPLVFDLTKRPSIEAAVRTVQEKMDGLGLRALVNNAAAFHAAPIEYAAEADVRRLFEVNVFGPLALTQACIPLLRAVKGRIVNVSSPAGRSCLPFMAPLSASKFAWESLSDAFRIELGPSGIETVVLRPGRIATMLGSELSAFADKALQAMDKGGKSRYGRGLETLKRLEAEPASLTAEEVAKRVLEVIEAPCPRPRYAFGKERILVFLAWLLPDRAFDRVRRRIWGFSV